MLLIGRAMIKLLDLCGLLHRRVILFTQLCDQNSTLKPQVRKKKNTKHSQSSVKTIKLIPLNMINVLFVRIYYS